MSKTNISCTSLIAYYNIADKLSKREKEVLLALKRLKYANNHMLGQYLNLPVNSITGRTFSLRKKGIVIYHHTASCPLTKETTKFYCIKDFIDQVIE